MYDPFANPEHHKAVAALAARHTVAITRVRAQLRSLELALIDVHELARRRIDRGDLANAAQALDCVEALADRDLEAAISNVCLALPKTRSKA